MFEVQVSLSKVKKKWLRLSVEVMQKIQLQV